MQRQILHRFYRASIRKACIHMLSTGCGEKNDAKLTAVCISSSFKPGSPDYGVMDYVKDIQHGTGSV
jgi:hypothetical protein